MKLERLQNDRTGINERASVFGRYRSDGWWCLEVCFL